MQGVEVHAADITAELFRASLLHHGGVLIRGAIPASVIEPLRTTVTAMLDHFDGIPRARLSTGRDAEAPERRSMWSEILNDGVHYNYDVVVASRGACSIYDVLDRSMLAGLIAQAFPSAETQVSHASCVRRMTGDLAVPPEYADSALDPHIDAMVHQRDALVVNFWTPLTDAGINEPGIAIVPRGVQETLEYLEFRDAGYARENPLNVDGPNIHYFRLDKLTHDCLRRAGLDFWRPRMRPGDVLAFTNYAIHATSRAAGMTGSRISIEARIVLGDTEVSERGLNLKFEAGASAPPRG